MEWVLVTLLVLVLVVVLVVRFGRRPAPTRGELVAILLGRYFVMRRGEDGLPPGLALNKALRASTHLLGIPQDSGFWENLDRFCKDAPTDTTDERAEKIFVTSVLYAQLGYVDNWFRTFEAQEALSDIYSRMHAEGS